MSIWKEEKYRNLQGTYPVISLSFANVKENNYVLAKKKICQLITNLYMENAFLIKEGFLFEEDAAFFKRVSAGMDEADASLTIYQLSNYLFQYYGKKVIILLDEYDTPMMEAFMGGYWDEMSVFIRNFFNSSFKANPYLERSLMTGITRISKESIFSDLNHLKVITTISKKYETVFGFTEEEVFSALEVFGLQDKKDEVKKWYDGFMFGEFDNIYNPWSIINFLDEQEFKAYWVNTSSNDLVNKLIREGSPGLKMELEDLLQGKILYKSIDEEIVFSQLDNDEDAVWSLLLAGGYLKITDCSNSDGETEDNRYGLILTNFEIVWMFRKMVRGWFSNKRAGYHEFIKAMLMDDVDHMNSFMNKIALHIFSSFDSGMKPSESTEPERFYHGFVLGMMIDFKDRYRITSNRESGFGRYDVMLEPLNQKDDGMILEFKVYDPAKEKSLRDTADAALWQIIKKKYAACLEEKGISEEKIRIYGFAFQGKNVLIDGGYIGSQKRKWMEAEGVYL